MYLSITWNVRTKEFHIFTDSGRLLRPIFVLKEKNGQKINDLINGDYSLMKNWNTCIHGYIKNTSIYNNNYYKKELNEFKNIHGKNYINKLEEYSAPIEYIDSIESEYSFIAKDIYSIDKNYTHSEIHNSLIFIQ